MFYDFDADLAGECEGRGWRAYYDRDWPYMAALMAQRFGALYHLPPAAAKEAAANSIEAARVFVPVDHDMDAVRTILARYYAIAKQHSGLGFDPATAAALEAEYWDVHRRLVGQHDKSEFVDVLVQLHSHIFGITPAQARESAELRVAANNTVDAITQKISADPEADWLKLEDLLRRCYRAIRNYTSAQAP